tara:strand:- start:302 stop:910 length:609 start_codon:yes stop_codon:yes gene_type:complete
MANKLYNFACDINSGRKVGCKDVIGGIKSVFLFPYDDDLISKLTFDGSQTSVIDDITSSPVVATFRFDVRTETSSFTVNLNSDDANGTYFNEQVIELTLQKISPQDFPMIDILGGGRVQAFVLDNNDNTFLCGTLFGMTLTAGAMQTGTAKADLTGFTITLTGREPKTYILNRTAGPGTSNYPFDALTPDEQITQTPGTYPA